MQESRHVFVSVVKDLKELKDWFSNRFEFFFWSRILMVGRVNVQELGLGKVFLKLE
jgi:hypothetical protein